MTESTQDIIKSLIPEDVSVPDAMITQMVMAYDDYLQARKEIDSNGMVLSNNGRPVANPAISARERAYQRFMQLHRAAVKQKKKIKEVLDPMEALLTNG
jgi:hypothetical protein